MNLTETIEYHTDNEKKDAITKNYLGRIQTALNNAPLNKIENEDQYQAANNIKRELCALSCFAANTNHEAWSQILDLENHTGKRMASYNKKSLIKNPNARSIAHYLLWNKRFTTVCNVDVIKAAAKLGILKRTSNQDPKGKTSHSIYIIGLNKKIGDNTFKLTRTGESRIYQSTIGRQAIGICCNQNDINTALSDQETLRLIPEIDEFDHTTYCGDGKGLVRQVYPTANEKTYIINQFG
ncbi:hypothetical protein ACP3V3_01920 [Vibrio sp. PNB22_3_1]